MEMNKIDNEYQMNINDQLAFNTFSNSRQSVDDGNLDKVTGLVSMDESFSTVEFNNPDVDNNNNLLRDKIVRNQNVNNPPNTSLCNNSFANSGTSVFKDHEAVLPNISTFSSLRRSKRFISEPHIINNADTQTNDRVIIGEEKQCFSKQSSSSLTLYDENKEINYLGENSLNNERLNSLYANALPDYYSFNCNSIMSNHTEETNTSKTLHPSLSLHGSENWVSEPNIADGKVAKSYEYNTVPASKQTIMRKTISTDTLSMYENYSRKHLSSGNFKINSTDSGLHDISEHSDNFQSTDHPSSESYNKNATASLHFSSSGANFDGSVSNNVYVINKSTECAFSGRFLDSKQCTENLENEHFGSFNSSTSNSSSTDSGLDDIENEIQVISEVGTEKPKGKQLLKRLGELKEEQKALMKKVNDLEIQSSRLREMIKKIIHNRKCQV